MVIDSAALKFMRKMEHFHHKFFGVAAVDLRLADFFTFEPDAA